MAMDGSNFERLVQEGRDQLAQLVYNNKDVSEYIETLISLDVPLVAKFREVNFCNILARNSESMDSLKKLTNGLNILEKYGRHLLKPPEGRSNMWRHIKYNNNIYSTRVHTLKGGREIMAIMGYSENRSDGVAFPENGEPDQPKVLNLVIDIILGKKELESYLNGNHPYPHYIEKYLGEVVQSCLKPNSAENPSDGMQAPGNTEQKQPTMLDFQPATLPALSLMETMSLPQKSESLPGAGQQTPGSVQQISAAGQQTPGTVQQISAAGQQIQGSVQQVSAAGQQIPGSLQQISAAGQQIPASVQLVSAAGRRIPGSLQQISVAGQQIPGTAHQISAAVTQSSQPVTQTPDLVYQGSVQTAADTSDAFYMTSQGSKPIQQTSEITNPQPTLKGDLTLVQSVVANTGVESQIDENQDNPPQENEAHNPSIACDICGENKADVICKQCDSKQLCKGCDIKWHKHPKRQNHKTDLLRPNEELSQQSREPPVKAGGQQGNIGTTGSQGQGDIMAASTETIQHQKPWLSQHQNQQPGYMETENQRVGQMYDIPHNYQGYSGNPISGFPTMHHPSQPYYIQRHPYAYQQYGQQAHGDRLPQKEDMTFMFDPVTGHRYEVPSLHQGRRHPNTIHDPEMVENRQASYFNPAQQVPASHMMTSSQSNYNQQRYIQAGTPYQPLSSVGLSVGSNAVPNSNPHMAYLNSTSQAIGSRHEDRTMDSHYNPQTPAVMSTPSPGTPLVSPLSNRPDERNFISSTSLSNKSGMPPGTPLTSKLLPRLQQIPDLEKRRSRLDIDLLNLKEDIDEWDKRINEIIFNYPDFFQNEEYKTLNNKKRKHLHEIKELEAYQKDLEAVITERIEEASKSKELETLRKLAMQKKQEVKKQDQGPPGSPALHPLQNISSVKGPQSPSTRECPGQYQPGRIPDKDLSIQDVSGLKLSSLETSENGSNGGIPEDVMKMLVLDQNPFDKPVQPKESVTKMNVPFETNLPQIYMNVPVEPPVGLREDVAYPPDVGVVNNMNKDLNTVVPVQKTFVPSQNQLGLMPSGKSAPNLQQIQHIQPPVRSRSTSGVYQWQCEHCTFINDSTVKACTICFKTSDNPIIMTHSLDDQQNESDSEHCDNCTFLNKRGCKQCEMCGKILNQQTACKPAQEPSKDIGALVLKMSELGQPQTGDPDATNVIDPGATQKNEGVRKRDSRPEESRPLRGLDAIIKEDQDQIYWEKKAAQEKYEKLNRNDNWSGSSPVVEAAANILSVAGKLDSVDQNEIKPSKGASSGASESNNSFETAKTSLSSPPEIGEAIAEQKHSPRQGAVNKGFKGASDFTQTIAQIHLKRDQEQMSLDAYELMRFLKDAEKSEFVMKEITIALQNCRQDEMEPLQWLNEKWVAMIHMVEEKVGGKARSSDLKDVGDISREEAREALLECKGDVEEAVKKCLDDRHAKFQKIVQMGPYASEDIQAALFQNHGDVDEAYDQLTCSTIQAYLGRLWDENKLQGRQAMLDEASARTDDLNNSVCNSVVSDDGFLAVIRNMEADRDRRIRMVFVEGKLMSWGRADLVIQILEQNILLTDDPLDCTLEDIIDAVRNCGDRKSSLVYLKQECQTCSGFFPMSKIRNLGVCNCKLCESCLKQCFEIAVREKFVRNWGCPICDAPGLQNDDTNATDYFDFLHLVLEQLVSKEVLDLYDIKLRDWHLQKEANFRWCAHCAFGFLWDRPDVLGMTCNSCRKKTCFSCKIKWEDQHQGLTCEEFEEWKINNDPEKQAKGVSLYLEENGIDCPSCKMRYSLAKGGCMHFRCPQCGHEFCSGCSQAFLQQGVCKMLPSCKNKGLHCHHPRDCFYYLRDRDVPELQALLKKNHIEYNTEAPPTQIDKLHCSVMEQKEYGVQKKDEACNKDIQKGHAGLCESHFKEYLVGLINKHKIDPITIMKLKDIQILIERNEMQVPEVRPNENEAQYRNRLMQFVKERFRLHR